MQAALYIGGRVVVGNTHVDAYERLRPEEKTGNFTSGFFDSKTGEFQADLQHEHFFDKKILLIRHGKVENTNPDPGLSQAGKNEVDAMSNYLKQFDLTGFVGFTSPLLRCLQTTRIVAKLTRIPFSVNPDIIESSTIQEDEYFNLQNRQSEFDEFEWPTEKDWKFNYETQEEFAERVIGVLQRLPKRCILISHSGFVLNIAKMALCNQRIEAAGVPTASITYIDQQQVKCLGRII